MSNDMKYNADEIASKLEAKAKQLRESGLSQDDLDMAAGGTARCACCGSSCTEKTNFCGRDTSPGVYDTDHPEACKRACIASSPD